MPLNLNHGNSEGLGEGRFPLGMIVFVSGMCLEALK